MKHSTKVMVVEDEILVGIMLVRKLRSFGYSVGDAITTGEEAIERAGIDRPEVILMDITLSGKINGLQAAREIRQHYHIPIIIFSGYDQKHLAKETLDIEPVAIVSKMGSIAELQEAIEKAVQGRA
jgi:two-component system, response regulator PdtaR